MAEKIDWTKYEEEPAPAGYTGKIDWSRFEAEPQPTWGDYGKATLNAIGSGLQKLDSYTGAPMRSAISAAQNADTPADIIPDAYNAARAQFGADPSKAPTGEDIVTRAGVKPGSTSAKVLGVGMDIAASPLNFVPVGEIAGGAVKLGGKALGLARGGEAVADAAPELGAAANAVKDTTMAPAVKPGVASKVGGKVAETMTGVDRNLASNYMSNTDRINQTIADFTDGDKYSEAAHANAVRDQWRGNIQDTRKAMNDAIGSAIDNPAASERTLSAKPIMDSIQGAIAKAHPVTQSQDVSTLKNLAATLEKLTDGSGNISLKDLYAFKKYARGVAEPSYDAVGNAIFPNGDFAAKMAKNVAGTASDIFVKNAPKSASEAESTLAALHNAEDTMSPQLLRDNGPVHAIARAGTNSGGVEAQSLKQLGDITGHDYVQDAKDFATARQFAAPKYTPETNGKSLFRAGLGAVTGGALGAVTGLPLEYSAAAGAAATSPGALKAGINLGRAAVDAGGSLANGAANVGRAGYGAAISPVGRGMMDVGGKAALAPSYAANDQAQDLNRMPATPLKGADKWAAQGAQVLGLDPATQARVMADPKARELLIQASDYQPGSKALMNIKNQIQKGWGK